MSNILRITDPAWFQFHKSINSDEVIFWTPGKRLSGPISQGEYIFFYVKSKPRFIGGYGELKDKGTNVLSNLWNTHEFRMGHNTLTELLDKMNQKTGSGGKLTINSEVGYFFLQNVRFFENKIEPIETYQIQKEKKRTWIDDFGIFKCDYDSVWGKTLNKDETNSIFEKVKEKVVARAKGNGNQNPVNKAIIEKIAIDTTTKNLINKGWEVTSVEKDNVGYDLLAKKNSDELYIEVKGLSGDGLVIELTPNEYNTLKNSKNKYVIAIVSSCLSENPKLSYYNFKESQNKWVGGSSSSLQFYERIGATVKVI